MIDISATIMQLATGSFPTNLDGAPLPLDLLSTGLLLPVSRAEASSARNRLARNPTVGGTGSIMPAQAQRLSPPPAIRLSTPAGSKLAGKATTLSTAPAAGRGPTPAQAAFNGRHRRVLQLAMGSDDRGMDDGLYQGGLGDVGHGTARVDVASASSHIDQDVGAAARAAVQARRRLHSVAGSHGYAEGGGEGHADHGLGTVVDGAGHHHDHDDARLHSSAREMANPARLLLSHSDVPGGMGGVGMGGEEEAADEERAPFAALGEALQVSAHARRLFQLAPPKTIREA